jgi:hydroxypyruvate reductase
MSKLRVFVSQEVVEDGSLGEIAGCEPALVEAVTTGKIAGAGLDVFEIEPNVPQALLDADNVVVLPHIASNTVESREDMDACVLQNIRSWLAGHGAVNPVPQVAVTTP